ncbi:MAG: hypothetical protein ACK571_06690, partial [Pseudanabaena sp.]
EERRSKKEEKMRSKKNIETLELSGSRKITFLKLHSSFFDLPPSFSPLESPLYLKLVKFEPKAGFV